MCSTPRRRTASLAPGEADRLNGWFQGLGLGYGDTVYVDGAYADAARGQVAAVAGHYGMLVSAGAPVTAGAGPAGHGPRRRQPHAAPSVPGLPELERPVAAQLRQPLDVELRLRRELATSPRWSPIPRT